MRRRSRASRRAPRAGSGAGVRKWRRLALICDGQRAAVYVDDDLNPEVAAEVVGTTGDVFVGGEGAESFEGKVDEVALYDRTLSPGELSRQWRAAERK